MLDKLFTGEYRFWYWSWKNRIFGKPKGCLCSMREDCASCFDKVLPQLNIFYKREKK